MVENTPVVEQVVRRRRESSLKLDKLLNIFVEGHPVRPRGNTPELAETMVVPSTNPSELNYIEDVQNNICQKCEKNCA